MTAHSEEILAVRVANMTSLRNDTTRRLDYGQVEQAVRALAGRLAGEFGGEELKRFRYTAIPRGGFIVLGMLAYVLDLPRPALRGRNQSVGRSSSSMTSVSRACASVSSYRRRAPNG